MDCGDLARSPLSRWQERAANEVVTEDASIDWNRSDYDPYARTKKFCEHMVRGDAP